MKQGFEVRQSQNMVMTLKLKESIQMLQLSSTELVNYLTDKIEENPFLEAENLGSESDDHSDSETTPEAEDNKPKALDKTVQTWEDDEISPAIYESDNLHYNSVKDSNFTGKNAYNKDEYYFEDLKSPYSLREYVTDQIMIDIKEHKQRLIALYITDYLDDNGYLGQEVDATAAQLQCSEAEVAEIIKLLQKFDPPGVFARDLAECLRLQLIAKNRLDPAMEILLENLDLMARQDLKALKKIFLRKHYHVTDSDLHEMFQEIRALNPKPGSNFSNHNVEMTLPDIFLKRAGNGNFIVELNDATLPRILINKTYYNEVIKHKNKDTEKKFLKEQMQNANWLLKSLHQRATTILKVASAIVEKQDEFLRRGINYLKPLVISEIASAIEMHESTVSRVINGKYMATHMGNFELKYFFSSKIGGMKNSENKDGDDVSSKTIKFLIKKLINEESESLSDDKIKEILKVQGIDIARRTVMKYREAMGIKSSFERKRMRV